MWKDDATAADILLAARAVQEFVAGMSQENFLKELLAIGIFAFTCLLISGRRLKVLPLNGPSPYLLALAMSANPGSVATLVGDPWSNRCLLVRCFFQSQIANRKSKIRVP